MPQFLSAGDGGSLALRAQGLLRRLQIKPSQDEQNPQREYAARAQIWCLPMKGSKPMGGMMPVERLADDVEELMVSESLGTGSQDAIIKVPSICEKTRSISKTSCGKYGSEREPKSVREVSDDVHKQLSTILSLIRELSGDVVESKSSPKRRHPTDTEAVEMLEKLIAADLPAQLLRQLEVLEFETRKDVMNVCCALLWPGMPQQINRQVVEYLRHHPTIFQLLVSGHTNEEIALHYGVVLRSCARHRELVEAFLESGLMPELILHTQHSSIDISSDAFYTLREILLAHKSVSAPWLEANFEEFFKAYHALLQSGEYIAERQAQKLLTEMLLDKHFQKVMIKYVSNERHLQIHMILLKDPSKAIQLQAFHVFKIFVANPAKPARIHQILYRNRDRLVAHLETLTTLKPDDAKVGEELATVTDKLLHLSVPSPPATPKKSGVGRSMLSPASLVTEL
mmetsp:Transcript_118368/g.342214  ORF Transcript_118368/g.342214 Transcript_118368/m.342214 type:complete len:455 (+) Transcript_118368:166-1530(+)